MTAPIYNPGQPFMLPIPAGGLAPGRVTHITGIVAPTATSIVVKLQSGPYGDPNDEIGLCIYGRVNEGVIGLNAFTRAAGWGQEQPFRTPALVRGQPVEITILSDPYVFKIAVNRQHLAEYRHVMNPALVNHLNIISQVNDFTLTHIWVQDPNQPAPPPPMGQPGMAPGMAHGMAHGMSPGMAPGVAPQYQGEMPGGYGQPGQPAGKQYGMGHMAGAAALGAVAGGTVGYMVGRRGSGSSSSSSDNDHGGFMRRGSSPERFGGGYDGQHTVVHHHYHQDNNDDGGDTTININIEGDTNAPNVAALTLEENEGEKEEEKEEEPEEEESSSSSEEEPEEEEEEEEEEPEEDDE